MRWYLFLICLFEKRRTRWVEGMRLKNEWEIRISTDQCWQTSVDFIRSSGMRWAKTCAIDSGGSDWIFIVIFLRMDEVEVTVSKLGQVEYATVQSRNKDDIRAVTGLWQIGSMYTVQYCTMVLSVFWHLLQIVLYSALTLKLKRKVTVPHTPSNGCWDN